MKHFLLVVVITFCSITQAISQWVIQPSAILSTGFNSYLFKTSPSLEVIYKMPNDEDAFYQIGVAFGYAVMRPTADTFRTFAIGSQFLPGYEVIHSYSIFSSGVTSDFNILKHRKLSPVIGLDIYFYTITIAEQYYAEGLIDASTTGDNYWLLAVLPRIGLRYKLGESLIIEAGCGKNISITGTSTALPFIKPYLSIAFL